ncbi:MAG: outer membrane lipoprotein carrier protein LolA [Bacteroidetes bacterium]|nr:MAG: outer membrane lipoprotein carrier protein LolA [Bacteroidota bacterium]REJ99841.1 MAG: outer membrane lipoprotein carrier protein LolA [Bacteroidota bacterium]REK34214.1 MAG: outer membrane lipoprotein carrier protein LolA [Bacteroidota bacterium]REK50544.1 MAG: outer membrane lipoprotein carrier protein LolA [Bacteroidota bacterium]
MKSKLLIALLFLCSASLPTLGQSDKQSQEILNGVSAKYKSYKSVKATFSIAVENSKDKSKNSQKGTIYIKGNKYKLQIAGQDVISDGKSRWTYLKDANEIQIDHLRNDENSITPTNVFTLYEKGWHSKYIGETKKGNVTLQQIELIPIDPKKKNVFKVKLNINKGTKVLESAQVYDKNGSIQTITVDSFASDVIDDENFFTFNSGSYPGAEVIDLR